MSDHQVHGAHLAAGSVGWGHGGPSLIDGDRDPDRAVFDEAIARVLRALRAELGFEVAFVSQFRDGERIFRYVDAAGDDGPVQAGGADALAESYCHYVVNGEIPEVLRDPRAHPVAARLRATAAVPVGTHLSVPIRFSDGSVYGTFCCFSTTVHDRIEDSVAIGLRVIAHVLGEYLEAFEREHEAREARREALRAVVVGSDVTPVFQPIVDLVTGRPVGAEALARFPTTPDGPAAVFAEAWALGVGVELEVAAATAALGELDALAHDRYMSVNASPETLTSAAFLAAVRGSAAERLVIEVTEHAVVHDYDRLLAAVADLRDLGVRFAIDDVGMGFSGLNHILRLRPHILKLDHALVRDVDANPAKQALASALVGFAARTDAVVVGEGIETAREMETLRVLGVPFGQGFHLGRPAPLGLPAPR